MIKSFNANEGIEVLVHCPRGNRCGLQERIFSEVDNKLEDNGFISKGKISRFGVDKTYFHKNNELPRLSVSSKMILFPNRSGEVKFDIHYFTYEVYPSGLPDYSQLSNIVSEVTDVINNYDSDRNEKLKLYKKIVDTA